MRKLLGWLKLPSITCKQAIINSNILVSIFVLIYVLLLIAKYLLLIAT